MPGTAASLRARATAPHLPVPKVELVSVDRTSLPIGSTLAYGGGAAGAPLEFNNSVRCIAVDVSDDMINAGLRLELLRYKVNVGNGNDTPPVKGSAYVHPADWQGGISFNGNDTRGGDHRNDAGIGLPIDRPSEWAITTRNQVVDMLGTLAGWWQFRNVSYRDAATPMINNVVSLPCPAGINTKWAVFGRTFGYMTRYRPNYFAWRYSVIDPNDARNGRIHGPMSRVVKATTPTHPFIPDASVSAATGFQHVTVSPLLNPNVIEFFWETRVP